MELSTLLTLMPVKQSSSLPQKANQAVVSVGLTSTEVKYCKIKLAIVYRIIIIHTTTNMIVVVFFFFEAFLASVAVLSTAVFLFVDFLFVDQIQL